mgnify:FL=1|tara:strand:+ start:183 stop:554 length:372 start_codon:yes stop_codon:yes gene_type:complete
MAKSSEAKAFDLSKYQVQTSSKSVKVEIADTGDEFQVSMKPMSWSRRNQLISKCLNWEQGGSTSFNGDLYVRECLKEMITEAPWGRTTEAFLMTIDTRLGEALEALVPKAFDEEIEVETVKKE